MKLEHPVGDRAADHQDPAVQAALELGNREGQHTGPQAFDTTHQAIAAARLPGQRTMAGRIDIARPTVDEFARPIDKRQGFDTPLQSEQSAMTRENGTQAVCGTVIAVTRH